MDEHVPPLRLTSRMRCAASDWNASTVRERDPGSSRRGTKRRLSELGLDDRAQKLDGPEVLAEDEGLTKSQKSQETG